MRVTQREMEAPDRRGRSRVKTEAEQAGMCRESPEAPGAGGGREGIPGAGRTAVLSWLLDLGLLASELREETATAVGHHVCGASSPPPQDTRTKEASGPDPSPPVTAAPANQQEEGGPAAASRPDRGWSHGSAGGASLRVSLLSLPASQLPLLDGRRVRIKAPLAHCGTKSQ